MKEKRYISPFNRNSDDLEGSGISNGAYPPPPKVRSFLGLIAGVLTVACLPQASLSAQSMLLFGHDYDIPTFGSSPEDAIHATGSLNSGSGRSGSFELGRVMSIDSVSVELAHTYLGDLIFSLTAPNGNAFSFIVQSSNDRNLGNLDGIGVTVGLSNVRTYNLTESTGELLSGSAASPAPAGDYRAIAWHSAPTGGWAPGTWTLFLRDGSGGDTGAIGRVEVHGALVPEPSAFALIAGLCAFAGVALRRRVR